MALQSTRRELSGGSDLPPVFYFILAGNFDHFETSQIDLLKESRPFEDLPIVATLISLEATGEITPYDQLVADFDAQRQSGDWTEEFTDEFQRDLARYIAAKDDLVLARDQYEKIKKEGQLKELHSNFDRTIREALNRSADDDLPKPAVIAGLDKLKDDGLIQNYTYDVAVGIVKIIALHQLELAREEN